MTWRERYQEAHRRWQSQQYPSGYKDFGAYNTRFPTVTKANGLRKMCCEYMKWCGHEMEPTNNMGRPIKKYAEKFSILSGKVERIEIGTEWQKGSGVKGTSDCKGFIVTPNQEYGIPVYIEIKIGSDKQSDDQMKYEARIIEGKKAQYVVIKTPEDFFNWYDYAIKL